MFLLYPLCWENSIMNGYWILSNHFSACIGMITWFYPFCWYGVLHWFTDFEPSTHSWNNWSWCMILLLSCSIWLASEFFWRFLHLCSLEILACNFLFCGVFGFGIRVLWLCKMSFGSVAFSLILWKTLRKIGIKSSLNV